MTGGAYDLRINHRDSPGEVDAERVRLTWRSGAAHADGTEAWRVVATAAGRTVVDSGWVDGTANAYAVGLDAIPLRSRVEWSVSLRRGSEVAETRAAFHTGIAAGSWRASWIGRDPSPLGSIVEPGSTPTTLNGRSWRTMHLEPPLRLRRSFTVRGRAAGHLFISAHGVYHAWLNGERIGDHELAPGWTSYRNRQHYQGFDLGPLLIEGENVLAVEVADGWWSGYVGFDGRHHAHHYGDRPGLIAELDLSDGDGERTIRTDGEWREAPGEIVYADLLMGERHHAALATPGWRRGGFDDGDWRPAVVQAPAGGTLVGQVSEPVRVLERRPPVAVSPSPEGRWIVDFGQNLAGRVRLAVPENRPGDTITIRHAEVLDGGSLYTENLRTAEALDLLTTDGSPTVFEPRHTVHGFRYAEIAGLRRRPLPEEVTAVVLSSVGAATGGLTTSSAFVDRLQQNIVWGMRSNFMSVPTDCPQRDERLGWTADTQVFAATAMRNADVHAFLEGWLDDLAADQRADGAVPDIVPRSPALTAFDDGAPGWGDAAVVVPWELYRSTGDREALRRRIPTMRRWVDYVARHNPDGMWASRRGNDYGDWLGVDEATPKEVLATALHARSAALAARAAALVGETDTASRLATIAERARRAFAAAFVGADGRVTGDTQTGYLVGLAWDLLPARVRAGAAARLVEKIEGRGDRLTSGFLGVGLLCSTLDRIGRPDVALRLLFQRSYPSWGYAVDHGATTVWERWDGVREDGTFQNVEMNSFNHYSLGSVGDWMLRRLGGIDQHADSAGYDRLLIAPLLCAQLDGASSAFETPRGRAAVAWTRRDGVVSARVEVPPGRPATVRLGDTAAEVPSGVHTFTVGG